MNLISEVCNDIVDFFVPSHCFCCERAVEHGKIICDKCYSSLERIPEKICLSCGVPKENCECADRVYHFSGVCSPFFNSSYAKAGIYKLKFSGYTVNAVFFGKEIADCVRKHFLDKKIDTICYVPTHPIKYFLKGFDHAQLLAKETAKELGIPYRNLLKRKISGKIQHNRSNVKERFENAGKSFICKRKTEDLTVLLVDDIKTTGATLDACSKALLYAGAKEVICATALIGKINS